MTTSAPPELLTAREAMEALRVSRATLTRMIDRGELTVVRLGDRAGATIRVPVSELGEVATRKHRIRIRDPL